MTFRQGDPVLVEAIYDGEAAPSCPGMAFVRLRDFPHMSKPYPVVASTIRPMPAEPKPVDVAAIKSGDMVDIKSPMRIVKVLTENDVVVGEDEYGFVSVFTLADIISHTPVQRDEQHDREQEQLSRFAGMSRAEQLEVLRKGMG